MVGLKVFFQDECRRAKSAPDSLEGLKRFILNVSNNEAAKIRYEDEDGDLISVTTETEYECYLSECKNVAVFYVGEAVPKSRVSVLASEHSMSSSQIFLDSSTEVLQSVRREEIKSREKDLNLELIESIRSLVKGELRRPSQVKEQVVHQGTSCSSCAVSPIIGILYKCSECPVHLCSICESSNSHNHPFYKIRIAEARPQEELVHYPSKALQFVREKIGTLGNSNSDSQLFKENLNKLIGMGFNEEQSVQALSFSKNDLEEAINFLFYLDRPK